MLSIRNIIFDLGGVFLTIDYQKTADTFVQLGVKHFNELYSQHKASPLFEALETGQATPAHFYELFRQVTGLSLSNEQIQQAWNAMLGKFPPERLAWLEKLKNHYKLYLFSNTNQIHYEAFQKIYETQIGGQPFANYFNKVFYSHQAGFRKPGKEAFIRLLEQENLIPAETLFIDDTLVNCQGAETAGMPVIYLQPPMTVLDLPIKLI